MNQTIQLKIESVGWSTGFKFEGEIIIDGEPSFIVEGGVDGYGPDMIVSAEFYDMTGNETKVGELTRSEIDEVMKDTIARTYGDDIETEWHKADEDGYCFADEYEEDLKENRI